MRLFVALDIEQQIRQRIAVFRDQMRSLASDVRWVGPETFHVTLQFLGETQKLDEVRHALKSVRAAPIELDFRGAGFFPNPKAPRIFWVGIESEAHLQALVSAVSQALEPLGFPRDPGPFTPHLTLARFEPPGIPANLFAAAEERSSREFGSLRAREFHLIESKLKPSGAEYTTLHSFPFVVEA